MMTHLQAAIDEAERRANALGGSAWSAEDEGSYPEWATRPTTIYTLPEGTVIGVVTGSRALASFVAHQDPKATLRRIAADRKLLDLHREDAGGCCSTCLGEEQPQRLYRNATEPAAEQQVRYPEPFPCPTIVTLAGSYGVDHRPERNSPE
jgi:hypothetical protein